MRSRSARLRAEGGRRATPAAPAAQEIDLDVSAAELLDISRPDAGLTLEEMQIIQAHAADPAVQAARRAVGLGRS